MAKSKNKFDLLGDLEILGNHQKEYNIYKKAYDDGSLLDEALKSEIGMVGAEEFEKAFLATRSTTPSGGSDPLVDTQNSGKSDSIGSQIEAKWGSPEDEKLAREYEDSLNKQKEAERYAPKSEIEAATMEGLQDSSKIKKYKDDKTRLEELEKKTYTGIFKEETEGVQRMLGVNFKDKDRGILKKAYDDVVGGVLAPLGALAGGGVIKGAAMLGLTERGNMSEREASEYDYLKSKVNSMELPAKKAYLKKVEGEELQAFQQAGFINREDVRNQYQQASGAYWDKRRSEGATDKEIYTELDELNDIGYMYDKSKDLVKMGMRDMKWGTALYEGMIKDAGDKVTFGLSGISAKVKAAKIFDKVANKEELTPTEQMFANAFITGTETTEKGVMDDSNYDLGDSVAHSAVFMGELGVTGGLAGAGAGLLRNGVASLGKGFASSALNTAINVGEYLGTAALQPSTYGHALDKMNTQAQKGDKENPFLVTDGDKLNYAKNTKATISDLKAKVNKKLKELEEAQINDPEGDHSKLFQEIDKLQQQRYGLEDKLASVVDEDGEVIKSQVSLGKALAAGFWNNIVENYSERIIGGKVDDLTQSAKKAIGANKTLNRVADKTGLNYIADKAGKVNDKLQRTRVNLDRSITGSDLGLLSKSFVRGTSGAKLFHSLPSEMVEEIFVQLTPKIEEDYAKSLEELTSSDFYTQVALSTLLLGGGGQIVGNAKNGIYYLASEDYRRGVKAQSMELNRARDFYKKLDTAVTDKEVAEEIAMNTVGTVFQYNEYQNKINDLRDLEKPDPLNRNPKEREEAAKQLEKTSLYNMAYQAASLGSEKEFKSALKSLQSKEDISQEMKANAQEAIGIVDNFVDMRNSYQGYVNSSSLYNYDTNAKMFERTARLLEQKADNLGVEEQFEKIEQEYRDTQGYDDSYKILGITREQAISDENSQKYIAGFQNFVKDENIKKYVEYKFNAAQALKEAERSKEKLAWELDPKNAVEIKKREDALKQKMIDAAKSAEEARKLLEETKLKNEAEQLYKINQRAVEESTKVFQNSKLEHYQNAANVSNKLKSIFSNKSVVPQETISGSLTLLNDTANQTQMVNEAQGIESPKSEDIPENINSVINRRFFDSISNIESDDTDRMYVENKEYVDEQVKELIDYFKAIEGKESLTTDEKTSFVNAIIVNKGVVPVGLTDLYLKHQVDIDWSYQEARGMYEKIHAVEKAMQEFRNTHTTPSKIYNQSKIEARADKKSIYYKASKIVDKYKGPEYSIKATSKNGKALIDLGVTPNEKGIITRAELEPFVRESLKSIYKPLFEKETKKIIKKEDYQKAITKFLESIAEIKTNHTPSLADSIKDSIQDKMSEVTTEVVEEAKKEKKEEVEQTLNNPETLSEKQEEALDTLIEEETTEEVKAIAEEEINEETTEETDVPEVATNNYIKSKFKQFLKGKYAGKLSSFFGKLKTKFRQILFGITIASSLGSFAIESTTQNYIDLAENKIENIEIKPAVTTNKYEAKTEDYKYGVENYYTENYARDENDNKKENKPSAIVLHHTGEFVRGEQGTLSLFQEKDGNSAHFVIGKDGKLYQLNDTSYVMHHAGKSLFKGKEAVNTHSIGIEIQGDSGKADFTKEQYETLITLVNHLSKELGIKFEDIVDHKTIRDNYIEAHPDEKEVYRKRDMDEEVMKHLTSEIKKVYEQYPEAKEVLQKIEKGEPVEDGLPLSVYLGLLAALQGISLGVSKYRKNNKGKKEKKESDNKIEDVKEKIEEAKKFVASLSLAPQQQSLEQEVAKEENLTEEVTEEEIEENEDVDAVEEQNEETKEEEKPTIKKRKLVKTQEAIPKKRGFVNQMHRKDSVASVEDIPESPILEEVVEEKSEKPKRKFVNQQKVSNKVSKNMKDELYAIPRNPSSDIQNKFIAQMASDIENNVLPNYPHIDLDTYITSLVSALGSTKVVEQNYELIVEAFETAKKMKLPQGTIDHVYKMQFNPIAGMVNLSVFGLATGIDNSSETQVVPTPVEIKKEETRTEVKEEPRIDGTLKEVKLAPHTARLYAGIGLKFGGVLGRNYTGKGYNKVDTDSNEINEEAKPFMDWRNFSVGTPIELKFNIEYATNPNSITSVWENTDYLNIDEKSKKPTRVRLTMKERLFTGKGKIEPIFKDHPTIKTWEDYVAELEKFKADPKSTDIFNNEELLKIMPIGTVNNGFVGPQEDGTVVDLIPGALNDYDWFNNSNVALMVTEDGTPLLSEREERIEKNKDFNLKARLAIAFNGSLNTSIETFKDAATNTLPLKTEKELEQGYSDTFQSIFSQFNKNVEEFTKNAGLAFLNNKFTLIGSNKKGSKEGEPLVINGQKIKRSSIVNWKEFTQSIKDSGHTNGRTVLVHESGKDIDGKPLYTIRNVITNHQGKQGQFKSLNDLVNTLYYKLIDTANDSVAQREKKAKLRSLFKSRFGYEFSQASKDLIGLAYPHINEKASEEEYRSDFVAKALNLKEIPDLGAYLTKEKSIESFIEDLQNDSVIKTTPLEVMLRGIHTNVVFTAIEKDGENIYTAGSQPVGMLNSDSLEIIELPKIQKKESDSEIESGIINPDGDTNFEAEKDKLELLDADINRITKKIAFNEKDLETILRDQGENETTAPILDATRKEIEELQIQLEQLQKDRETLVGVTGGQIGGAVPTETLELQLDTKINNVSAILEEDLELTALAEEVLDLDEEVKDQFQENFTNFVDNFVDLNFNWLVKNLEDLGEIEKECN